MWIKIDKDEKNDNGFGNMVGLLMFGFNISMRRTSEGNVNIYVTNSR